MKFKTKFNVGDKVYFIDPYQGTGRIVEDTVDEIFIVVSVPSTESSNSDDAAVSITYVLKNEKARKREDVLFSSVSTLVEFLTRKNNVVSSDPDDIIWD